MRTLWFGSALAIALAGCTQTTDDGLSQLERQVKHGLQSVALDVSDEQLKAASSAEMRQAYMILNSSGQPREMSDAKKRARLKKIFYK